MKTILIIYMCIITAQVVGQPGKSITYIRADNKDIIVEDVDDKVIIAVDTVASLTIWFYFQDDVCVETYIRPAHSSENEIIAYLSNNKGIYPLPDREYVWYYSKEAASVKYIVLITLWYDDGDKPYIRSILKIL